MLGERDELTQRLSGETELRSDVTMRLRQQVQRRSSHEAELNRLNTQLQSLEAVRVREEERGRGLCVERGGYIEWGVCMRVYASQKRTLSLLLI